ncbi:MAG: ATPase, T2SS/T4P/T4SS family [Haloarculaceae archaeon]
MIDLGIDLAIGPDREPACACEPRFEGERLVVDADGCPGGGELAVAPACRETVVRALRDRGAESVVTRAAGVERAYEDAAAALLVAAGRFADAVAVHDATLSARAMRDPLGAAREATGRAGPVADRVAETGLAECASRATGYGDALRPYVAPTVADARLTPRPPSGCRLRERYDLDTGATVRVYEADGALATYHLTPVEATLGPASTAVLAAARERLAAGNLGGATGDRAAGRAVRAAVEARREERDGGDLPIATIESVLDKHTRGLGTITDLFADGTVSDVFVTAPVGEGTLRVRADGETMRTNVRLTADAATALASRFRRESGRSFSRAEPTIDATVEAAGRRIRVAGVTDPVSDGHAFAFRAHGTERFRPADLVANGTFPPSAAAVVWTAVARGAAVLFAGARGAGKTTALGAFLWAVPAATRTVVIEDTPELPVGALRGAGRDVQRLRVSRDGDGPELAPAAALRTALRLGDGALAVGEVRGTEAGTLYEAMRVGAGDGATLGTIHGSGGAAVRERVVSDLGVAPSAFTATDLVVTLGARDVPGGRQRYLARIEEVLGDEHAEFAPLFDADDADGGEGDPRAPTTGRIRRGNSRLVASLSGPGETYADVRERIGERADDLAGHRESDRPVDETGTDRTRGTPDRER